MGAIWICLRKCLFKGTVYGHARLTMLAARNGTNSFADWTYYGQNEMGCIQDEQILDIRQQIANAINEKQAQQAEQQVEQCQQKQHKSQSDQLTNQSSSQSEIQGSKSNENSPQVSNSNERDLQLQNTEEDGRQSEQIHLNIYSELY